MLLEELRRDRRGPTNSHCVLLGDLIFFAVLLAIATSSVTSCVLVGDLVFFAVLLAIATSSITSSSEDEWFDSLFELLEAIIGRCW